VADDRSAINQQIALKTIKKLNFSVNAVWNGKEALDYLLKRLTVASKTRCHFDGRANAHIGWLSSYTSDSAPCAILESTNA
jgi:CheY-like chemotaxis protein